MFALGARPFNFPSQDRSKRGCSHRSGRRIGSAGARDRRNAAKRKADLAALCRWSTSRAAAARSPCPISRKKRATRTPSDFFTGVWVTNPLTTTEANGHRERFDADRPADVGAGGGRGQSGFAVQEYEGLHRGGEEEPEQLRSVRRLGDRAGQSHAPVDPEGHRHPVDLSFLFPAAASGCPISSAATCK